MGRHDHAARQADVDGTGRPGRVRARVGPARTNDGHKRAKARGVKFGRPMKLTAHQRQETAERLADGVVQADLARSYGVSQATVSRLAGPSPFGVASVGA